MSEAASPKQWLRPAQVASKLGVSVATIWRLVRDNPRFPRPYKPSERVAIFDELEIDAFVVANKATSQ